MFMVSFRLSRKKVIAGAVALVVLVGVAVMVGTRSGREEERMASAATVEDAAAGKKIKTKKVTAKTNEDRIAFAEGYGWEVDAEAAEVLEVIIPEEFDQVYLDYNSLQRDQGFDLTSYAGKRCKRYSYRVTNHPGADGEVRINLLLHGDRLVGGDVCSVDAGGFMHGFSME